jgi:hypothetical protein
MRGDYQFVRITFETVEKWAHESVEPRKTN